MRGYKKVFEKDNPEEYLKYLRQLKQHKNFVSSLYTKSCRIYYKQIALDKGWETDEASFVIHNQDRPFFGFIGAVLKKDNQSFLTSYDSPCLLVEAEYLSNKERKCIKNELDNLISKEITNYRISCHLDRTNLGIGLEYLNVQKQSTLTLIFTRIIDLDDSEAYIKSRIRKSYKSLINWGLKQFSIKVLDFKNIKWEDMKCFRELHIKEAGRSTRSLDSWKKQFDAVKAGEAFTVFAFLKNELVSAGLFTIGDRHCYYGVSASRRDLFSKPIFHSLMWKAITYAKSIDIKAFETGLEYSSNIPAFADSTDKERQISLFKAGFGGRLVPLFVASNLN